ncbi:hypothetical protein ACLKA7_015471 [Drosophila subpalustris]
MVASETGVSVEKCKRRWRQIRADYVRWMNTDDHRHRNGLKRPTFYLADELKFLNQHLSLSDLSERERESLEREQDSKSSSKEPSIEKGYKDNEKDILESVDDQPLSKLKQTTKAQSESESDTTKKNDELKSMEADKSKELNAKEAEKLNKEEKLNEAENKEEVENQQEKDLDSEEEEEKHTDDKEPSEDSGTPSADELKAVPVARANVNVNAKKPEFFIKQSNKASPNCLIIGKKQADVVPAIATDTFEPMADDCSDETASTGGRGRRRRTPARIKDLPIQKVADQRLTRLQRRKSMCIGAANSLRSSTSPVKMTPLPRSSLAKSPSPAKTPVSKPGPKPSPKPTTPKQSAASSRDDIFPRPRAAAPVSQQVVLARRPGQQQSPQPQQQSQQLQQQQQPPTTQLFPVRGVGRPPGPARVAVNPAKRTFAVPTSTAPRSPAPLSVDALKMPPVPGTSSSSSSLQRPVSASGTLVISTTSGTISTTSPGGGAVTASITASPIVSTPPPVLTIGKRCERSTQTENHDVFSDDYFLDMVRPQMREMNSRQKMHFKQKIFHALMEIFDDATDFPNSGEVQHFNINTPSGFENVSDPELRLVRELVSMVSAAKHTTLGSPPPVVAPKVTPMGRGGIQKAPQRAVKQLLGTPGGTDEDKKLYRMHQMSNNSKIISGGHLPPSVVVMRKDSIDSNSSSRAGQGGNRTFVVPNSSSPKTPQIADPLTNLFATSPGGTAGLMKISPAVAISRGPSKAPVLVRQMGRRFSVCGAGGPNASLSSPAASAAGASVSGSSPANNITMETLKRRLANPSQSSAPLQQRVRYSHSPQAIAPGNSLLVRHAAVVAQKQLSPTGGNTVPQKMPQIASIQGGSFNAFTAPNSVRGTNPSGVSTSTPPLKRGMVIANVKGSSQQKSSVSAVRQTNLSLLQGKSTSTPNVANLLGDSRPPNPAQSQTQSKPPSLSQPQPAPSAAEKDHEESEMAGIIAADYFDMSRLKREPQENMDDDILGM